MAKKENKNSQASSWRLSILNKVQREEGIIISNSKTNDAILEAMKRYAQIKCEEQRQLCFEQMKHQKFGTYGAKRDKIINAPEPKFD